MRKVFHRGARRVHQECPLASRAGIPDGLGPRSGSVRVIGQLLGPHLVSLLPELLQRREHFPVQSASLRSELAGEGARVVLAARREAALERIANDIRRSGGIALPIVTDLAQDDSLANLVTQTRAELGQIDILVNNAGYAVWKPLEATSMAEWDQTFAVNVRAAAYLCAAVLPEMQQRKFGRIVNVGSEAAVAIVPGLAAYCVSKHALRALS